MLGSDSQFSSTFVERFWHNPHNGPYPSDRALFNSCFFPFSLWVRTFTAGDAVNAGVDRKSGREEGGSLLRRCQIQQVLPHDDTIGASLGAIAEFGRGSRCSDGTRWWRYPARYHPRWARVGQAQHQMGLPFVGYIWNHLEVSSAMWVLHGTSKSSKSDSLDNH